MAATFEEDECTIGLLDRLLMGHRGPSPDAPEDLSGAEEILERVVKRAVRRATVEIRGDYNEGGGGKSSWQGWMLTVLASLTAAAIIGGVAMFGKLSSLESKVEGLQYQMDHVEKIVEPRYRGQ